MESAKAFIERMKTDEEFARKVSNQKDNEERMKFVTAEGFNFTGEEIKMATEDLTDEDLAQVTGGNETWDKAKCTFSKLYSEIRCETVMF